MATNNNQRLLWTIVIGCMVAVEAVRISANEQPESKYQEIIQLFNRNSNDDHHPLKAEAQTYSATVTDPSGGYSRDAPARSRYSPSSSNTAANREEEEAKKLAEEEEERKPDRLALLLSESKFSCNGVKNGYYADETVGCQVFHYCVEGVKHSWQCPENTVFHQIHLNCVPNTQDICQQSSKYHIVNEYLHKELDERGPNNTILYHQRFYPDGFDYSGGDPVAQIFQAQAQAALQKAHQRQSQPTADQDDDDDDEQPVRPSRTRSRPPQSYLDRSSSPPNRASAAKPSSLYRQPASRTSLLSNYSPAQQTSKPTLRPSSPETFAPPTYTEQPQDDFGNTDFSDHHHHHPSSSSGFDVPSSNSFASSNFQSPSSPSSQSFQPSGSPSAGYTSSTGSSSSSSFSPSNTAASQGSGYHRSTSSSSRGSSSSGYPTRSLGIPIASFRVAPASSFTGSSGIMGSNDAQASSIQQVRMVPPTMMSFTTLNNGPNLLDENGSLLYY
uniref:Uncharacterized protein DDB_G0271670-like n=1 Tax=Dermatophagoides pteronyssinus TaxID=6956 RepID=A0A6P6Y5P4_DERPT|nr:uncharacterized protein DDB_G0271670-like [Dermatophagoides pteronyssinus]